MTDQAQGVVWDLRSYFPKFDGPEMRAFKEALASDIKALQERAAGLAPLSAETAADWERVMLAAEDFTARLGHIASYVGCLESADASEEAYGRERAKLSLMESEYEKFEVDVLRAFKGVPDEVFASFTGRKSLAPVAHALRRSREEAKKTMPPAEEKLASDLNVDGFHAWGRLYDTVSSKIEFEMRRPDGKVETLPISRWRSLMGDADREVGRAAFEGGNKAWEKSADVCAAALNAISGTRLTLNRHRGVGHFLDKALFQASVTRKTLDAMYAAVEEHVETARDIFRAKSAAMGRRGIHWYEREAPLPLDDAARYSWKDGAAMVGKSFGEVFPELAEYYKGMLEKRWIESESRGGKRPGAFCTGSAHINEQRVYMTFNGSLGDVSTLAHEVGHAFHGHLLRDMRPWARRYPMTLAETASIFGEHILAEGVYSDPKIPDSQKLLVLDGDLCGAAILLLDITVRFKFEKAFYEERAAGEVSVSRLKELMVKTQKEVWGDALADGGEDPLFWASKLHFYITDTTFYNFPYTFGFLMARSLFNLYKKEGPSFLPKYKEFLRLTGSDTVEGVARRSIGADTEDPAFWSLAITSLKEPLAKYKALLEKKPVAA